MEKQEHIVKTLTIEEFETLRDRSIMLGVIAGLVENFYDKETETIEMGVVKLLTEYHILSSYKFEVYHNKLKKINENTNGVKKNKTK